MDYRLVAVDLKTGGLAQLARAPALHAGGHRFESDILHTLLQVKEKGVGIKQTELIALDIRSEELLATHLDVVDYIDQSSC